MRKCPYCAEEIQDEARKCKHCGEFLNSTKPVREPDSTEKCLLHEGTRVILRVTEPISSQTAAVGDRVSLMLSEDLRVGELIFAKCSAPAVGTVTHVKKAGMLGKGGELNLRVDYVKVGSSRVPLRSSKGEQGRSGIGAGSILLWGAFSLLKHGKGVEVPAGATIQAYVDEDVSLPSEKSNESSQSSQSAGLSNAKKFCMYCGTQNEGASTFCYACGRRLASVQR